ncbi:MAG: hypothetical protein M1837_000600 [Sclerophora amabilis]|nr:MAG: hypothetical protein M1837_000600 [Sclerophora amabilis]
MAMILFQRNVAKARRRSGSHQPRRPTSYLRQWKDLSFQHTWVNPLILLVLISSAYAIHPTPSNPFHRALFLSYPLPREKGEDPSAPIRYGKGPRDLAFVAFYIIFLSFAREFLMQRLIRPLALRWKVKRRAKQSRFMEQMYTAMYYGIIGPYGLYVMSKTPTWYFNTTAFFEDFPHRSHDASFKAYYLLQASYWAQQAIVLMLQLEKPRKDFKELVGHHIITLSLIGLSYRFHFTYMGLAVYITHDISDFFLATSKMLNYLSSVYIGPYFALFVGCWIYLRHYLNLRILWATLTEFRTVGPFELDWETQQYKCSLAQVITFSLLASLQAVNIFWLVLILRIAKNYVFSHRTPDDERSDNEDDDEQEGDEDQDEKKKMVNGDSSNTDGKESLQDPAGKTEGGGDVTVLLNGAPVSGDSTTINEEDENTDEGLNGAPVNGDNQTIAEEEEITDEGLNGEAKKDI